MTLKKLYLWTSILLFIEVVILISFILFFFRFLPSKLPLFYSLSWGDKQLANHVQFLIIPAILAFIGLLNLTLSFHLHQQQLFFKKILIAGTLISTLILTITFIKIVFIFV